MSHEICVAVIHGMGAQQKHYSDPLRDEINRWLGPTNETKVKWGEVYWADILEVREKEYFDKANANNELDWIKLRKFMLSAFGDASAYRKTNKPYDTAYDAIHERVSETIKNLDDPNLPAKPLILIAHSLGGHIMSNYIYDMKKHPPAGLGDFQQMKMLAGIITFGCNIPFFTLALKPEDIKPIDFPGSVLPAVIKAKARWLNYYDPDDVLGWPLRAIDKYRDVVHADIPINTGGIFTSWNPLAHQKYWTDNDFTKPVARFIAGFLS